MSEAYIVLAHYREKNRGSLVLGYFQSYKEALECDFLLWLQLLHIFLFNILILLMITSKIYITNKIYAPFT